MKKREKVRCLCEGAILVALAQVLSFLKLWELPQGGSVTLAMLPVIFFAVRWGAGPGFLSALVFGILQLIFDGAFAWSWQSMLGDYVLAFTMLGFAGFFKGRRYGVFYGTVLASVMRFLVHYVVGATVWAAYMPEEFFGRTMTSPWLYSLLYNGSYIALCAALCLVVFAALYVPMRPYMLGEK